MKIARPILFLLAVVTLLAAPYQAPKGSQDKQPPTSGQASTQSSNGQIDINSASVNDLKSLPGIGEAYSAAIIKNRPYANKRQLVSRKVIPQATYDKISDRIVAKQGKSK